MSSFEEAGVKKGNDVEGKIRYRNIGTTDGHQLYEVFLSIPDSGVVDSFDVQEAKGHLDYLFQIDPDAVLSCADKTLEEAGEILRNIDQNSLQQEAA